jgi:hypothetical protein
MVSNQSEYQFLNEPSISTMPLLVVADAQWGEGETHFADHRFRISTYSLDVHQNAYRLRDEFVTHKKYASLDRSDKIAVISYERAEVVTRLRQQR